MTVRDMIDYVQSHINSRRYWNDTRLISLMNVLQPEFANELKLVFQDYYSFESVANQKRYMLPSELVSIELLWYDNSGTEKHIKVLSSPRESYIYNSDPDTEADDMPYEAFIWHSSGRKELWIYPMFTTDGVDVNMWFYGTPPKLTGENDTPVLPVESHAYFVETLINRTLRIDEQITVTEELGLWKSIMATVKSLETVKEIMTQRAVMVQDRNFPTIIREDMAGLRDGSHRGIIWG